MLGLMLRAEDRSSTKTCEDCLGIDRESAARRAASVSTKSRTLLSIFGVIYISSICLAAVAQDKQQEQHFEINGLVRDADSLLPIAGAKVLVISVPAEGLMLPPDIAKNVLAETQTSFGGKFTVDVVRGGKYQVEVTKEGYRVPIDADDVAETVSLDDKHPNREVTFLLARPSELSGCLVDEETNKAITNLRVHVMQRHAYRGEVSVAPEQTVQTGSDGCFVVRGLDPGEYLVRVGSRLYSAGEIGVDPDPREKRLERLSIGKLVDDESKRVAWDYDGSWLPSRVPILDMADPIVVRSGVAANLGSLSVRKVPVYSVHVVPISSSCTSDESISVDMRVVSGLSAMVGSAVGAVPCGNEFFLRGVASGTYQLELALLDRKRENRETGTLSFNVVDRDVKIYVPIVRGVDVHGEFICPDSDAKPDMTRMHISLRPLGWAGFFGDQSNPIDGKGHFFIPNVATREQHLEISNVPPPYFVKEIRYAGHKVLEDAFLPVPSNQSNSLQIFFDDKPATVWGIVTNSKRPVKGSKVFLVRHPYNKKMPIFTTSSDDDGKFTFGVIPPGEYRILAIGAASREKFEHSDALEATLSRAENMTLGPSEFRNLSLKTTEIR